MFYEVKASYLSNFRIKPAIEYFNLNNKGHHIKIKKYCVYLYMLQIIFNQIKINFKVLNLRIGNFVKYSTLTNILSSPNRHKISMHQVGNSFYKFSIIFKILFKHADKNIELDYFNLSKFFMSFFLIFFKNIHTNFVKLLKLKINFFSNKFSIVY